MSARVLVVDDIEANRRVLQAKLEAKYFDVILAKDGFEALEVVARETPDIILLDIMMPGMDGFEVCRRLKEDPKVSHIPVVMVTALNDQEDRVRGLEAGAEDFITKPVDDFALMSRIEALMRYNSVARELRDREASGRRMGALDADDQQAIQAPSRILVLDGNDRTANRYAKLLQNEGHTAITLSQAGDLNNATNGIDIILLSMVGQSFDPLRLCAHFKMNDRTRALSIIAICDPSEKAMGIKALELGASDIILTPVDKHELLARVKTQSRRTRYVEILRKRVDRGLELSVIDPLTGLYNRRYMLNQLEQWMHRSVMGGKPVSVLIADIDHFKSVNDTWGHDVGDVVLREFAARMKQSVRPVDIVCRQGGEEFVIILPDTAGDVACTVAERVRQSVAGDGFEAKELGKTLDITVSVGVATLAGSRDTPDAFLKRADEALYAAKSAGRNRVESVAA